MNDRLSRWSNHLIEAGWLTAALAVPLFFNVYSERVFDADKTAVLRSVALFMAAVWLARSAAALAPGRPPLTVATLKTRLAGLLRQPLALPLLLLALAYLLATAASVAPALSWAGSYRRWQGSYTMLAYLVVAALTLATLRTRPQVERLVTAVILTTIPITLYAALQRYNLDPIPWSGGWQVRVQLRAIGQMGHPIFVAAFLMMVAPLTAARLAASAQPGPVAAGRQPFFWLRATLYATILLLQLLAILWSGSRGPLLGLAGGATVFLALVVALLRRGGRWRGRAWRRLWLAGLLGLLLLGGWLLLFNLPPATTAPYRQTPLLGGLLAALDGWRDHPALGRFGHLLETGAGSGRVRILIWEGMVDLVRPHEPLAGADGRPDPLNGWRPLLGYGPETLQLLFGRYYRPEIATLEARDTAVDRAHNESLDLLATTGLAGFLAWQFLYLALVYAALRCLALLPGAGRARLLPAAFWLGGGLLLASLAVAWRGPAYAGLAYPAGNVLGLLLHLLWLAARARPASPADAAAPPWPWPRLLAAALLAALLAHYLEIQLGIAVVATRSLFFVLAALLAVLASRPPAALAESEPLEPRPPPLKVAGRGKGAAGRAASRPASRPRLGEGWSAVLADGLLLALLLAIVAYGFVLMPAGLAITSGSALATASDIVHASFFTRAGQDSPYVFALIVLTWLLGAALLLLEPRHLGNKTGARLPAAAWLALAGLALAAPLALAFGLWAGLLAALAGGALLYWQWQPAWGQTAGRVVAALVVPLWLALALACFQALQLYFASFAPVVAGLEPAVVEALQPGRFVAAFFLFLLALALLIAAALGRSSPPAAGRHNAPVTPLAWAALAALLLVAALAAARTNLRPVQADVVYKQAAAVDRQAFQARDPARLDQAIAVYERAVALAPAEPVYRTGLGLAYLQRASITTEAAAQAAYWQTAEAQLRAARDRQPLNADHLVNLGRLSATRGRLDTTVDRDQNLRLVESYYRQALALAPTNGTVWDEFGQAVHTLGRDCRRTLAIYDEAVAADPYHAGSFVSAAGLWLECAGQGDPAAAHRQALAALRQALAIWATSTNPEGWERLALQYSDLASFDAALAEYEQGRAATRQQMARALDQAEAALDSPDLPPAAALLTEALALARPLLEP